MKDAIRLIMPGVSAGICLVSVLGFSIATVLSSLLYSSWGKSSAGLEPIRETSMIILMRRGNRLGRRLLLNLTLCLHIKQGYRVSLLELSKLNRGGVVVSLLKLIRTDSSEPGVSTFIQMFITRIVALIAYRYEKISCIIGLSVKSPKKGSLNHWSHFTHFRLHHAL